MAHHIQIRALVPSEAGGRNTTGVTKLHYSTLHCTALHCTALHCTALHCSTALHNATRDTGGYSKRKLAQNAYLLGKILVFNSDIFCANRHNSEGTLKTE